MEKYNVEYSSMLNACGCAPWGVYTENGVLVESFNTLKEAFNFAGIPFPEGEEQ